MNLPPVPLDAYFERFEDISLEMFRRIKRPVIRRFDIRAEVRPDVREIDKMPPPSMKSASFHQAVRP